ncbi:Small multidrug resistance protein, SMR family [Blastococcus saxobsidens DD2]|uniref:Small multidrug resistance protein, SMR family n=1 Tax=Blastococcus saxobsidens (strain DD2) TaxID=1146883 RepID=H6RKG8_BLASD|nr:Small multidrug resistance protein, SMR family [Blastococcus saxobsidens DD2]
MWTGVGAVGTAVCGMLWLGDPAAFVRIASILMIVGGIVGLNLAGSNAH